MAADSGKNRSISVKTQGDNKSFSKAGESTIFILMIK